MNQRFALTAAAFEASLTVVAIALGWLVGQPPLQTFEFNLPDAAIGLLATAPLLVVFWGCLKAPLEPLRRIAAIMDETVVPLFQDCDPMQLAIVSLLAGVGEEMLFRGVIQPSVAQQIGGPWSVWLGLLVAAVLFGLLHLITPTYAILAALIGGYLGWLWIFFGNLLVPIVAHAAYDFVAMLYLVKLRGSTPPIVAGTVPVPQPGSPDRPPPLRSRENRSDVVTISQLRHAERACCDFRGQALIILGPMRIGGVLEDRLAKTRGLG